MISTDQHIEARDILLRSVWPADRRPDFWNGKRLVSSAFKDPKGLSVSRVFNRSLEEAVDWMRENLTGPVFSISVISCNEVNALIVNIPSTFVPYHYEIHGGENSVLLSDEQALFLARSAKAEYFPAL